MQFLFYIRVIVLAVLTGLLCIRRSPFDFTVFFIYIYTCHSSYSNQYNKGILLVDNSAKAKKTLGDRAFVNAAPRVWNRLPLDIRLAISYDNFKSMLKTHFFRLAFYD